MPENYIGKILIVDDEVELKNALVDALASQSFEVRGVSDGRQALAALREEDFDLLLSDLMMPGMDGIELVKAALEIDPHLIAIIMTGQGTIQTAVDAMKAGTFDYVLKPFRLQAVLPVLTRALSTRRLRLENLQLRETVAIYELSQTIAFTLDAQTIINKLADAAVQQTDADEVSVLLPTDDGTELYVAAVRGENRQRLVGERVPLEESISGWVARQREPLILDGEVDDDRFRALWPHPEIRSAVSVPMQVANKLVGTININSLNRARPFTLGQMKALTILASTAAAALESASLYAQLRQAEAEYRSIFENAAEGICRTTVDGKFITANPALAQIFGYDTPEELISAVRDLQHDLYVDAGCRREFQRQLAEHSIVNGFEASYRRKDGEVVVLSQSARAIRDENGEILYYEGVAEDITERKRAEEALRASEAEMRALFASMNDVILVLDDEGRHLKVAPTSTPHLYRPAEERIGKTLHEIFPQEKADFFLAQIRRALKQGRTHRAEYSLVINGVEYWYDGSISPMSENTVIWVAREITERKRAEQEKARLHAEIESQRQRLDSIVASVPGVVWEAWGQPNAATQRIDFVSDYVETMLGYSVEEWLSTPNFWLQIVHPDDREEAGREAAANFVTGKSSTVEFRWVAKDGRAIWVESNYIVISDAQGQPAGVRGVTIDITERKRAEEALRESEESYRDLVENAHDIIYSHDLDGKYTSVNRAGEQITGYNHDECLALNISDTVALEYQERVRKMIGRKVDGEGATAYELEILAKDGRRIAVEVNTKLKYQDGAPVGVQGIARDITERKLAQAERTRLAAAVEQTAESIVITDTTGAIEYVNPAFERTTGYSKNEVLGQNPRFLKSGKTDQSVYRELWETIALGDVWTGQLVNKKKDGTLFNERATISAVRDEHGKIAHYLAVKQDTTHETQLEEQLRQSQKMEAIGQLAGGVAHDFNNLLTAINGYSSLALQRVDDHNPIKSHLEEIRKAGERAANLTRQLLAFGRKQILQPLSLNLNDVVTDMNKMLKRLIGEDIELTSKLTPDLKRVKADPGQVEQVLVNLVVNARDAMPKGGNLTIETGNVEFDQAYSSKHVGVEPGSYVMLAVSDTGVGMDEETRARIFEPFFTTKAKGKGTGLGLSTVYGIIRQTGGNIWVYSEPGRGTTFKVYVPAMAADAKAAATGIKKEDIPIGSETVLLVEDEDVVRGLAVKILEQAGYKVLEARRGEEAIQLCSETSKPIDLLLTDVVIPEISGKEVADRLSELRPGLKVLYMSGYTDEAIVHHGVLDSSVQFIQKPFTPAALATRVREVLDVNGAQK